MLALSAAGVSGGGGLPVWEVPKKEWDKVLGVNVSGVLNVSPPPACLLRPAHGHLANPLEGAPHRASEPQSFVLVLVLVLVLLLVLLMVLVPVHDCVSNRAVLSAIGSIGIARGTNKLNRCHAWAEGRGCCGLGQLPQSTRQ